MNLLKEIEMVQYIAALVITHPVIDFTKSLA